MPTFMVLVSPSNYMLLLPQPQEQYSVKKLTLLHQLILSIKFVLPFQMTDPPLGPEALDLNIA